ncbi:NADH:ubiquinone oxidoreductase 20.1kD subunit [Apiospora saccharicola]|uniref:NADH:ubiquinone oxidoreductase 20.1kD subunit n=1 Tax=Apiospora saccharicola TaxID=335842 RepID=A0ABR1WGI2_9PEZI
MATMLPRRIAQAPALRSAAQAARRLPMIQRRCFLPNSITDKTITEEKYPDPPMLTDAEDPNMNGGFINPPRVKRQFRDPYADWWDKQERRNFGEPVHEDHDVLGMFSPYEYTWVSPAKGAVQFGAFVAVFLGVCYMISQVYPDKQSYPREYEGGLERELGGKGAVRARAPGDPEPYQVAEEA